MENSDRVHTYLYLRVPHAVSAQYGREGACIIDLRLAQPHNTNALFTKPTCSPPSTMALPITQEVYREDAWSDISDLTDSASDTTSSEDGLAVPVADSETSATNFDADADALYGHLRRRLEQTGVLLRGLEVQSDTSDTMDDSTAPPIPALPFRVCFHILRLR